MNYEHEHEAIKKWILKQLAEAYPEATINETNWFQFNYQDVNIHLEGNVHRWSSTLLNSAINIRIRCNVLTPAYNRIICSVSTTGVNLQKVFDKINQLNAKAAIVHTTWEEKRQKADALVRLQREELPHIPEKFNIHREADGRYSVTFFSLLTLAQTRALIAATQGILEQP